MNGTRQHNGLIELHFAVLLFGGTALFSKLIPLGALDITLIRAAIAAVVLAFIVKLSGAQLKLRCSKDYVIALILGIIVSLHWVTYFKAMQLSSVAIGIIAFFTYPVMTVLIEPILNKQSIKMQDVLSGIIVLFGVYLLLPEINLSNNITLGIAFGVLSAALFTARNLIHKRHFSSYSGSHAMFYQTLVASLFLYPFHDVTFSDISPNTWGLFLILGIMFTAFPHALFTSALRALSAKTVGLVSCLQPFYASFLALIVLGEALSVKTIIGGALIVATALFETHQSHKKKSKLPS